MPMRYCIKRKSTLKLVVDMKLLHDTTLDERHENVLCEGKRVSGLYYKFLNFRI